MTEVRRICAGEAQCLRRLRLGALADAPDAFELTYAAEASKPDWWWNDLANRWSSGETSAMFIAYAEGAPVALAGAYRDGSVDVANLFSMWTDPTWRRRGVARALIGRILVWVRDTGGSVIELWVTEGNEAASALYRSLGFEPTNDRQPLPSNPSKTEVRMRRSICDVP